MPSRRLALIHTKEGPWVCTHGVSNPHVRITGLKTGRVMVMVHFPDKSYRLFEFAENGLHPIEPASWTRVWIADGDARALICEVVSGRAA